MEKNLQCESTWLLSSWQDFLSDLCIHVGVYSSNTLVHMQATVAQISALQDDLGSKLAFIREDETVTVGGTVSLPSSSSSYHSFLLQCWQNSPLE